jgi:anti-sigma28 factor (negative regulator of flagellin synthesis)
MGVMSEMQQRQEQRGRAVSTIKPINGTPVTAETKAVKKAEQVADAPVAKKTDRVAMRREDSGVHRLYEQVDRTEASDRAAKIAALKKQVQEGTYRPNLETVAQRLLPDLGLHLN